MIFQAYTRDLVGVLERCWFLHMPLGVQPCAVHSLRELQARTTGQPRAQVPLFGGFLSRAYGRGLPRPLCQGLLMWGRGALPDAFPPLSTQDFSSPSLFSSPPPACGSLKWRGPPFRASSTGRPFLEAALSHSTLAGAVPGEKMGQWGHSAPSLVDPQVILSKEVTQALTVSSLLTSCFNRLL